MTMRLLRQRLTATEIKFRVWLDTTKLGVDGNPDPAWLYDLTWGRTPPQGQTITAYRATVLDEAKRMAALELARRVGDAGTALPEEGTDF